MEVWQGLSAAVVDAIADNWYTTDQRYRAGRMEHYFSAEFLMGRALLNNLTNLGLVRQAQEAVGAFGQNLSDILEQEPDAALGNGGLGPGRLLPRLLRYPRPAGVRLRHPLPLRPVQAALRGRLPDRAP